MLTDGEWEAFIWYFKIYSRVSPMLIQLNPAKKLFFISRNERLKVRVIIAWILVQIYNPLYIIPFYILVTQEEEVPIVQIIFFGLVVVSVWIITLPSCMIAFPQEIQNQINGLLKLGFRFEGDQTINQILNLAMAIFPFFQTIYYEN